MFETVRLLVHLACRKGRRYAPLPPFVAVDGVDFGASPARFVNAAKDNGGHLAVILPVIISFRQIRHFDGLAGVGLGLLELLTERVVLPAKINNRQAGQNNQQNQNPPRSSQNVHDALPLGDLGSPCCRPAQTRG